MYTLDELITACMAASNALAAADKVPGGRQYAKEFNAARIAYREALAAVREALAAERGWEISKPFYLSALCRGRAIVPGYLDALVPGRERFYDGFRYDRHLDCFRTSTRPYKPVAAVSHCYARPDEIAAFAELTGLSYEILPLSWSDPRHTAVLFSRKGT
ncbi:MAG: hypothetical protein WD795_16525 [Woeseia sp.]